MTRPLSALLLIVATLPAQGLAEDLAPLEAYGDLPTISAMALSPSGNRIAYRTTEGGVDAILVQALDTGEIVGGANVAAVKPRSLQFVNEDTVLMVVSKTSVRRYGLLAYENSSAFVLDVTSNSIRQLLLREDNIFPAQSGLGRVIGHDARGEALFMPAFAGNLGTANPPYSLFDVSVNKKGAQSIMRGSGNTVDWFVDEAGSPFIEEEYDDRKNIQRILVHRSGELRVLYESSEDTPRIGIVGLTPSRDALVYSAAADDSEHRSQHQLNIEDGTITGPFFERAGTDVEAHVIDLNRIAYGVRYAGFLPTYEFSDQKLDQRVKQIQASLKGTAAYLVDWTPDFNTLLFRISGGWSSGGYVIAEGAVPELRLIKRARPEITDEQVVPTTIMQYEARDGVKIPALLTAREELRAAGNMPLIVMPHGGPESHDRFGFDWLAQYFASRGYAVLQPQFRGSSGFGEDFADLGRGEWGGKMSTDLDDGVQRLIDDEIADPDRVCIVGGSYGGYAALAAGAFSKFNYKCIVSIAGVSDLPRMLTEVRKRSDKDNWVLEYWKNHFGSAAEERAALKAISPVEHAAAFRAPVLLVHGKKDTVVTISQSTVMAKALRRADKDVTFEKLKDEDHWLSGSATRLATLEVVAEFIRENL